MKKLALVLTILMLPSLGFAASEAVLDGYVRYEHDLKSMDGYRRFNAPGPRTQIRGYDWAPYQYGKAGENEIEKKEPAESVLLPGVEVGKCLNWKTCKQMLFKHYSYNNEKPVVEAKYGRRFIKKRNARDYNNNELDGSRSGRNKVYRYYFQ